MNSEIDQARSAIKTLMQARASGKTLDLSNLPEPVRKRLQAQLDKLPPEMQKELLAKGPPIVEKAIERVAHTHAVIPHYSGHYNNTIQPGDRLHLTIGRVLLFVGILVTAFYFWSHAGTTPE